VFRNESQWPLTHLVWDLVAQDGHSGRHAGLCWRGESCSHNQAIGKVMKTVSHDYHHSQQRNPLSWEHKESLLLKLILRPWWLVCRARRLITGYCTLIWVRVCSSFWRSRLAYSDVEDCSCLYVQETFLRTLSRPLVPAGKRQLFKLS